MKIKFLIFLLFQIAIIISCENNNEPEPPNYESLATSIINFDQEIVSEEFNKLLTDMSPHITSDDPLGHENNFSTLIDRINSQCENINAELLCYACIKTYPAQSEIKLTTDSSGVFIYRIIDILTSSEKKLFFVRIHY